MATERNDKQTPRGNAGKRKAQTAQTRFPRRRAVRRVLGLTARALTPILVLALAIVSFAGLRATKPEVPQRPVREQVWPVNTIEARFSDFQPRIRLYGRTISGRTVDLRALVAGEVIETGPGLKDGGVADRGDLLLRIDPFKYEVAVEEAQAQLKEARARLAEIEANVRSEKAALASAREQLEIAQRDLQRAIPLAEGGTVSQQTVDNRRLTVSERKQAVELRENNLAIQWARAEQQRAIIARDEWRLREAERDLADTVLRAPFDAYVTGTGTEVGRIVSANDQVARLFDRNWIEVRFTLTNAQYGRIVSQEGGVTGRMVEVFWHVGEKPVRYEARIERVAAEISAESGGVDVFARIVDPLNPIPIRPGAFVEIQVTDRLYSNVVRLPQTALYGGSTVYVVKQDRLASRTVDLVGAAGPDVLVRGDLKPGEHVMTTRLSKAEAGLKVQEQ